MNDTAPTPQFSIFHVDDCMYVAALSKEDAAKFVRDECGEGCGDMDWIDEVGDGFMVEMANVDDGEKPTPQSKKLARDFVTEHLQHGGSLPWTVAYDQGM